MHQILFTIGSLPIHSYGFMLALSFLFGIWLARKRASNRGLDPEVVSDLGFWIILSAIFGARVYYILLHPEDFVGDWGAMFNPFHGGMSNIGIGGLVMYGGFIGAVVAGVAYFSIKNRMFKKNGEDTRLRFLEYADACAPSVGFGIFLTRIGCFFNGCCYGSATNCACSVSFPVSSPAGYYQASVHAMGLWPSQLFESFGGLIMGILILWLGRKKVFSGFEFYLVVIFYSTLRFFVDFSRVYTVHERFLGFSHNQIVCIVLFIVFGGLILGKYINKDSMENDKNVTKV